jgi:hypothetical protein
VDTEGVATESEDLAACSVEDGLLDALLLADATDHLLDDILDVVKHLLSITCQLCALLQPVGR